MRDSFHVLWRIYVRTASSGWIRGYSVLFPSQPCHSWPVFHLGQPGTSKGHLSCSVSKRAVAQTAGDVAIHGENLVRMGHLKQLEETSSYPGKPKFGTRLLGNSVEVEQHP